MFELQGIVRVRVLHQRVGRVEPRRVLLRQVCRVTQTVHSREIGDALRQTPAQSRDAPGMTLGGVLHAGAPQRRRLAGVEAGAAHEERANLGDPEPRVQRVERASR